jgi:hypothetical protein
MDIEYLTVEHLSTKDLIRIFSKIELHDDMWFNGSPCWIWCGNRTTGQSGKGTQGYGHVRYRNTTQKIYRVMFAWLVHPLPKGRKYGEVDHLCRVHACCNPTHLDFTDHRTNMLRGQNAPSINATKTHCIHGHPLSGNNLFYDQGFRQCRICKRAASKRRQVNNPESVKASSDRYKERNRDKVRQRQRDNKDVINARARETYHRRKQRLSDGLPQSQPPQ